MSFNSHSIYSIFLLTYYSQYILIIFKHEILRMINDSYLLLSIYQQTTQ